MTYTDAVNKLEHFCSQYTACHNCELQNDCWRFDAYGEFGKQRAEVLNMLINKIDEIERNRATPPDNVNHPHHYNQGNSMECIDEMILLFGKEVVKHFCLCNAWKYRYRANEKNGLEDRDKADWYIKKYQELSGNG